MSDADRRARMLAQPCDRCGAAPGERCHTRTGRNSRMHADRWYRAQKEADGHQSDIDRVTDIGTHYYGDNCTPPHGSDLVRQAADMLSELYLHMSGWPATAMQDGDPRPPDLCDEVVSLLRAVADENPCDCCTDPSSGAFYSYPYCPWHRPQGPSKRSIIAALALADTILGDEK